MARKIEDIKPSVRRALERFVQEVLARQSDNVVRIVLFGSVARGDDNEDSDIDVFLLLKHDNVDEDLINSAISADDMSDYETYTTPFSMSLDNYIKDEDIEPVIKNINREGIVLYDTQQ